MRTILAAIAAAFLASPAAIAWGGPGHRLTGLIAASHLTPIARQHVAWLLGPESLADVAGWADRQVDAEVQTSYWHYVNIPQGANGYDRDRDCPRQPGVAAGARNDRWRDCAVDRILYVEERLADLSLDRADRATALKFLVHFVGDLHQPLHAIGVARGGNDMQVRVFGVSECGGDPARPAPCNLHGVWDSRLIAHRELTESAYVAALERQIADNQWNAELQSPGTPVQWADESFRLAKAALVAPGTNVDEAYYRAQITVIDRRLATAGLRLAAELNRLLTTAPPANGGRQ